jgi:hypothetical protein
VSETQPTVFGAILLKGGRGDFMPGTREYLERDIHQQFDVWKLTEDFKELMAARDDRVLVAESESERRQMIENKHPAPAVGLTFLQRFDDYVNISGNRHRDQEHVHGYKVLPHPWALKVESIETLQNLCIEHKSVFISDEVSRSLGGGWHGNALKNKGFVVYEGADLHRITFNPRNLELKGWRAEKEKVLQLLSGEFPDRNLHVLRLALCPSQWRSDHVMSKVLVACDRSNVYTIMRLLEIVKKFLPKSRRTYYRTLTIYSSGHYHVNTSVKDAINGMLVYVWGAEDLALRILKNPAFSKASLDRKNAQDLMAFCRWLRNEAHALKLAIPPKPVVPPKPLSPAEIQRAAERKKRSTKRAKFKAAIAAHKRLPPPAPESPVAEKYVVEAATAASEAATAAA